MARITCTIWALLLHVLDLPLFQTCFASAMEDEEGEPLLTGPRIAFFPFAAGVYTILARTTLFPANFRKPYATLVCIYEFLATSFFLEFATACIWTPIDVLMLSTLPKAICHMLSRSGLDDTAESVITGKAYMAVVTFGIAMTFFLATLHATRSVDFDVLTEEGAQCFATHVRSRLWHRIQSELPRTLTRARKCRCKAPRRDRSRSSNKDYYR